MILITGANGYVGAALIRRLLCDGRGPLVGAVRKAPERKPDSVRLFTAAELSATYDWTAALEGVRTVVHTAARVHQVKDDVTDSLSEYRRVNVGGTLDLARQAARSGVDRFIFVSSIKVNGEQTTRDKGFSASDIPSPMDPYGISKWEAEQGLLGIATQSGMEVVIVRPPLVYGPGVKAHFQSLIRIVNTGVPLPLGAINNLRSLVALDNLIDLLVTCISHPQAANQLFLVSDDQDISIGELIGRLAIALGRPPRLISVPEWIFSTACSLTGYKSISQRLCGSLRVDINKTKDLLGWSPIIDLDEGLRRAVAGYRR